jgi:hypothetical protein
MQLNPSKFVTQVDAVFATALAPFGFTPSEKRHDDDWFASRTYRAGDRYVVINANCHFRDGQPECRVILGDGSTDWPHCDWNSIALWQLTGTGKNYPIDRVRDIPSVLIMMRSDLLEQAEDFLSGKMDRFLKQRAAHNREREPYTIYSPQPDGTYQGAYDPDSLELKKPYSQE